MNSMRYLIECLKACRTFRVRVTPHGTTRSKMSVQEGLNRLISCLEMNFKNILCSSNSGEKIPSSIFSISNKKLLGHI